MAPRTTPSLGSSCPSRFGWRRSAGPSSRIPTRSLHPDTVQISAVRSVGSASQSSRGPASACSTSGPVAGNGAGAWSTTGNSRGVGPTGSRSPALTGGGPIPDRVSVAPPGTEYGRDVDPAAHREVRAQPHLRSAELQRLPVPQRERTSVRDRMTIDRRGCLGTGERDHHVTLSADRESAEGDLERGRRVVLGQQPWHRAGTRRGRPSCPTGRRPARRARDGPDPESRRAGRLPRPRAPGSWL